MKFDHDADDLLVLARRGDLPEADARRLRDALAGSGEARLLYEAGRAFDREAPVLAGDDERIAAIQRYVQKRMRPSGASRRAWAVRLCVAAALITGAAIGGLSGRSRSRVDPASEMAERGARLKEPAPPVATPEAPRVEPATTAAPAAVPPSAAVAPRATVAPRTAPPPPAPAVPLRTAPRAPLAHEDETATIAPRATAVPEPAAQAPSAPTTAEPPTAALPAPPALSAPELFAAANRARVDGDAARAVSLSRELEERFPRSREAVTTHLSLGLLYLQQGAADDALLEFRRYRAVGAPSTMPDAFWGESRALRQLGRVAEERAVLEDLLYRYPGSAYAAAARHRLTELR